jgi:hypothetical protein
LPLDSGGTVQRLIDDMAALLTVVWPAWDAYAAAIAALCRETQLVIQPRWSLVAGDAAFLAIHLSSAESLPDEPGATERHDHAPIGYLRRV